MSEKKYPEEFKREMVRQFHGSGQTQTDYAKKKGLKLKTFSRWVREDWSQRPKEEQDLVTTAQRRARPFGPDNRARKTEP